MAHAVIAHLCHRCGHLLRALGGINAIGLQGFFHCAKPRFVGAAAVMVICCIGIGISPCLRIGLCVHINRVADIQKHGIYRRAVTTAFFGIAGSHAGIVGEVAALPHQAVV